MKNKKKLVAMALALVVAVGVGVGGTLAYLATKTGDVVNTFTYGDINIKLKETANGNGTGGEVTSRSDLKLLPGVDVPKDPFIKVKTGSEDCWLYVKVTAENWPDSGATYELDTNWKTVTDSALSSNEKLYYYDGVIAQDTEINILKDKKVTVATMLAKPADASQQPKLTFTGFAIQKGASPLDTAQGAWDTIKAGGNGDFVASSAW